MPARREDRRHNPAIPSEKLRRGPLEPVARGGRLASGDPRATAARSQKAHPSEVPVIHELLPRRRCRSSGPCAGAIHGHGAVEEAGDATQGDADCKQCDHEDQWSPADSGKRPHWRLEGDDRVAGEGRGRRGSSAAEQPGSRLAAE
eukprot:CAMPEP_0197928636 /NCGR_PEP_ID=MMETSP1439-20131203/102703_1 /TAXON_ID=66791 /ORGANISM="Gonyaulax spinifera, Strain CCMP409" /LENGTH=145 /DNA_ID=CAMNT_0043551249 /DNA_START=21 /DNA_END=455 /DNA_ORIENTATION=+